MTATLGSFPVFRALDADGAPLVGGLLYSFAAGTLTPLATYVDAAGVTTNANPVVLDSTGSANVWFGSSAYKLVLKTSTGSALWTVDNYQPDAGSIQLRSDLASTASAAVGDALVGVKRGTTARTQHSVNGEVISVLDYGVAGDGTTPDQIAFKAAVDAAANKTLWVPSGVSIYMTDQVVISSPVNLVFEAGSSLKSGYSPVDTDKALVDITASNVTLDGMVIVGQDHDHIGVLATSVSGLKIVGGTIGGTGKRAGIRLESVTDTEITGLSVTANLTCDGSTTLGAIYTNGCSRIVLNACTITGYCGKGFSLRTTDNSSISNCTAHDMLTTFGGGIYIGHDCSYISVASCHFKNISANPVKISRGAYKCSVIGCDLTGTIDTGSFAMLLQGAVDCSIVGCTVDVTGDSYQLAIMPHANEGVVSEGSDSYGNIISDCVFASASTTVPNILLNDNADTTYGTFTTYKNTIANNRIYGGYIGVESYTNPVTISGNLITGQTKYGVSVRGDATAGGSLLSSVCGNKISGSFTDSAVFVSFSSAKRCLSICRNTLQPITGDGIYMTNAIVSSISDNVIMGAAVAGSKGIVAVAGSDTLVMNNNAIYSFVDGIYVAEAAATGIVANGNTMKSITGGALYFNGVSGRFVGNFPGGGTKILTVSASVIDLGNA